MKIALIVIVVIIVLIACYYFFIVKPKFGGVTTKVIRKTSKQYDQDKKKYVNPNEKWILEYERNRDNINLTKEFLFKKRVGSPSQSLPYLKINLALFQKKSQGIHFAWLGHSSVLININGVNVLVDPVFSESVSPVSLVMRRFQPAVIKLDELPTIDLIVISHDHYDHLDMETIEFFAAKPEQPQFMTPLGVGEHLKAWGINNKNIQELDWWDSVSREELGIELVCTPAQHFSGRRKTYENQTLWSSWIIKIHNSQKTLFFSGDSGYSSHFKEIGNKFGPIDLAFIENGQYNESWKTVHMMPEETVQASIDLSAKLFVPIHWGMFNLAIHDWFEPVERVLSNSKLRKDSFVTPQIGEVVELGQSHTVKRWWQKLM